MARVPPKKQKPHFLANTMLLNVGGVGLCAIGFIMAVQSLNAPKPETPTCETRYQNGVLFSYKRKEGTPLSPEDLQARLGGTDRGLMTNSRVVMDQGVPQGYALEVSLKRSNADEDDQARSGIGYTWAPRQLGAATSACLSYSVWVPEDFTYGTGGALPGLVSNSDFPDYGIAPADPQPKQESSNSEDQPPKIVPFAVRMIWTPDGRIELLELPNQGHKGSLVLDPQKASLKQGKWTRIEFEVTLNEPGKPNGTIRAWVNGKLVDERFDTVWRMDEMQSLQAVVGGIHHISAAGWAPAPVNTRVRISPLELRLR